MKCPQNHTIVYSAPFCQATDSKATLIFKLYIRHSQRFNGVVVQDVLSRCGPLRVIVTTRIIIFLGDPKLNRHLPLLQGGGDTQKCIKSPTQRRSHLLQIGYLLLPVLVPRVIAA